MNLFSRISEILDGDQARDHISTRHLAWHADRLVKTMEKRLHDACQSAFALIAAKRTPSRTGPGKKRYLCGHQLCDLIDGRLDEMEKEASARY
jgi:hypothetical protein